MAEDNNQKDKFLEDARTFDGIAGKLFQVSIIEVRESANEMKPGKIRKSQESRKPEDRQTD